MKRTKLLRILLIPTIGITTIAPVVITATSCNSAIKVTGVTLNKSETTIGLRGTETLVATVSPTDATDKTVTWSTDDETIASVNQKGVVTGMAPGKTNITVKTNDGGFEAKCQVTVTDSVIHVTGVTLDQTTLSIPKAKQRTLTATISPENATDKSVTWTSSDEAVATVDQNGNVIANATGEADITVTTTDGGYEAKCHVTVTENVIHVTGVTLNKSETTIGLRGTETLVATVSPTDATDKTVTWSTDDETIASVNQKGVVTGMAPGKTNITVKTNDGGFEAKCQVTVTDSVIHVTGVTLDQTTLSIPKAEQRTLTATISPENATDKSVTWTSSDEAVATVDQNGNVTANATGEADITVTTTDGGYEAKCHVTVTDSVIHVTSVTLKKESAILDINESETLDYSVLPENATDKRVTWSSSDESVATVDKDGKVTAIANGTVTITATSVDQKEISDSCEITVSSTLTNYVCLTANENSTLELENTGGNNPNLSYSFDNEQWDSYSGTINIDKNQTLYLKGDNEGGWSSNSNVSNLKTTGDVSVYGSVMGLVDNGTGTKEAIPNENCFGALFYQSVGITTVNQNFLASMELTKLCYQSMFSDCVALTKAPDLPATDLTGGCYWRMFMGCSLLNSIKIGYEGTVADSPNSSFNSWVSGIASKGTFYYKGSDSLENFGFPIGEGTKWVINKDW